MVCKGYIGLSVILVVSLAALFVVSYGYADPAGALCNYDENCDSGHCVQLGGEINSYGTCVECVADNECPPSYKCDAYACARSCTDNYPLCSSAASNNLYFYGTCQSSGNANCVGRCTDIGQCCASSQDQTSTYAYECTGCPSGYTWSNSQSCSGYNHCEPICQPGTYLNGCSCLQNPVGPQCANSGEVLCPDGSCKVPTCFTNSDCPSGTICQSGGTCGASCVSGGGGCSCSSWSAGSCGGGGCPSNQRQYTRSCSPSGCSFQSQCQADVACGGSVCSTMTKDTAVRGGCENNAWSPVYKASANECAAYCNQNGANACEWNSGSGDCYVEFGNGCYLQGGFAGWYSSVGSCPVCGNGQVEGNEQCDSGSSNGACPSSCSTSCTTNDCSAPTGWIDYPNGNTLKGTSYAAGWALDYSSQVSTVTVKFRGPTNRDYFADTCGSRIDVCNAVGSPYQSYAGCGGDRCKAGWTATVDTTQLSPGTYNVYATACDIKGNCADLSGSPKTATINQCSGVSCNNPPSPTCVGNALVSYSSPGSCSATTGACSYSSSSTNCAASNGWYDSGGAYITCHDNQNCRAQNQEYRTYGCSSAACSYSITDRRTVYSGCDPCPTTGCSGNTRLYNGGCFSGSNACSFSGSDPCNNSPAPSCSGSTRIYYDAQGTCSSGTCSYTQRSENCANGCLNGACLGSCPDTCSGTTRQYSGYRDSGGNCQYSSSNCANSNGCVNSGTSYATCADSNTAVTRQNRVYNSYSCSSGSCYLASSESSGSCPPVDSGAQTCSNSNGWVDKGTSYACCSDSSTRATCQDQDYRSYSCSSGNCNSYSVTNTRTLYSGQTACNSPPENVCEGNSLRVYSAAGSCSGGGCSYSSSVSSCQYGCLSLQGNDQCATNSPPSLGSVSASPQYVKSGQSVTVASSGSDPNGEQVRLRCGSSPGGADLCTSGYTANNPSCSFSSPWSDNSDHTTYCWLEDTAGAGSATRTSSVSADSGAPTITLTSGPSGSLPSGTSTTITYTASDSRSGVSSVSIFVDGTLANTCSGTCSYTFTPSYRTHSYYGTASDNVGNSAQSSISNFIVNDAPTKPNPTDTIRYTGDCRTGSTITLRCTASDPNQAANTLAVSAWAGECSAENCYQTRSWATGSGTTYLNNAAMNAPSNGGIFTKDITITSSTGTVIAATCRATDEYSALSEWGDMYGLCTVDGCQNPPVITVDSITPNPTKSTVTIVFHSDRALKNSAVMVRPGSQAGGVLEYPATLVSSSGNSFTYSFAVQPSYANGRSDVRITGTAQSDSCAASIIDNRLVIDTTPPSTTIACNGAACNSNIYNPAAALTFSCNDATTSCNSTSYSVNGGSAQTYNPASPPSLATTGTYAVNYWSTDGVGNVETAKSQEVRVYGPPCNPSDPACTIKEEVRIKVVLDRTSVLTGETITPKIFCFLRDKNSRDFIRMCSVSSSGVSIIIDKGTSKQKDYFTTPGVGVTRANFLSSPTYFKSNTAVLTTDGRNYDRITSRWELPLNTEIFRSELCVNMTDGPSGYTGEDCGNYTVSNSQLLLDFTFPDVGVFVPLTTDGTNNPNFTKLMPINFLAVPKITTFAGTSACTDVNCRVEFSFLPYDQWSPQNPPLLAQWNGFKNGYIPLTSQVASNVFNCDQYKTLYMRATSLEGLQAELAKPFFINCDTKITANPAERRFIVGDQPGNSFNITVWNPKEIDKTFDIAATATHPSGYPLPWTSFDCTGLPDCTVGTGGGDDTVRLSVPHLSSRTAYIYVSTAARSGTFPVRLTATDETGTLYSTLATILIFAEGLDEFALWQLAGLIVLAVAVVIFSNYIPSKNRGKKPGKRRK